MKKNYFDLCKFLVVGKFGSPFGIYGWIKLFSFTENIKNIFKYKPWFVKKKN